jgi:hypothetical protein
MTGSEYKKEYRMDMDFAYRTKNFSTTEPYGFIHLYNGGENTLCGKEISGAKRWYIWYTFETENKICPKCLSIKKEKNGR